MTSIGTPLPKDVAVRHLRRAPPKIVWKVVLGIGLVGRVQSELEAERVRTEMEAAVAARAAIEARRLDSLRLVQAADTAVGLHGPQLIALDARLHAVPYTIPHDHLHARAVRAHLDSASNL